MLIIQVSRGHPTDFLSTVVHMYGGYRSFKTITSTRGPYYLGGSATSMNSNLLCATKINVSGSLQSQIEQTRSNI
jgi:hypothetical protein